MSTSQIVPLHDYPHVMVVETDNSAYSSSSTSSTITTYCNMLFCFTSPKGKDRVLQTLDTGFTGFTEAYGIGSYDEHGQAFLNAYNAASTNAATLHCLRVTADDATFAAGALIAHYKTTPGSTTTVTPDVTVASAYIDVFTHEGIVSSDSVANNGITQITIAGVDVEAAIVNTDLFPDVSGNVIDVAIDLATIANVEADKTYKVTQYNPELVRYVGTDEFVSEVNGQYAKIRTYSGSDIMEGYCFLLGEGSNVKFEVVEWGVAETATEIFIVNNTDMSLTIADSQARANVNYGSSVYTVATYGDVVPALIDATQWGAISGNYVEAQIGVPGLVADTEYTVSELNAALSVFSGETEVSQEGTSWKKTTTATGAELAAGYALLIGDNNEQIILTVSAASSDEFVCYIANGFTFVAEHSTDTEATELGDVTKAKVISAIAFPDSATSTVLTATASYNTILADAGVTTVTVADTDSTGSMDIYYTFETITDVADTTDLGNLYTVDSDIDVNGYQSVKIFEIACVGRGSYGNDMRFTLESYARGDSTNGYKNYTFSIYEMDSGTLTKKEEFTVALTATAVDSSSSPMYIDYLVGDPYDSSDYVSVVANSGAAAILYAAYAEVVTDTTLTQYTFDPLTGKQFGSSLTAIPNLTIDTTTNGVISVSGSSGITLNGGSDGEFATSNEDRQDAIDAAILKAYCGEVDRNVASTKMYPTDLILDAAFPTATKAAIAELVAQRQDCMAIYDVGTIVNTTAGIMEEVALIDTYITTHDETIEAYRGKIQDPATYKLVDVTSTYALAYMLPTHFRTIGDKHVPMAGSSYGILTGFISGTAWPVYDEELDSDTLDDYVDSRINYLKVNSNKQVVRGTQTTRQTATTNLSEMNNVMILHDIRRRCIRLCETYEYNFCETTDLQRFNTAAGILADEYADAQVSSITATFDISDWESENGILHLYVNFVHKNIVKRSIVEININRDSTT